MDTRLFVSYWHITYYVWRFQFEEPLDNNLYTADVNKIYITRNF